MKISKGYIKSIAVFCISQALQQLKLFDAEGYRDELLSAIKELIEEIQGGDDNECKRN